jgi:hypothetical protein
MLMIGKPLNAQQRLMKAVVDIMGKDYFTALSGVLMALHQKVQPKDVQNKDRVTSTAITNGLEVTYAEEFVDSLSDAEFRFLMLHEAYHCMYKHLITWEWMYDIDGNLANQACDHVINLKLLAAMDDPSVGKGFISSTNCARPSRLSSNRSNRTNPNKGKVKANPAKARDNHNPANPANPTTPGKVLTTTIGKGRKP